MHVALVSRWYPPHTGFGGVAMHNHYLARALVRAGHRVTVVAARETADVPAVADDGGVRVLRVLDRDRPWLRRLPVVRRYARSAAQRRYSRRVAGVLEQLGRDDRPDVVEFADVGAEGYDYLRGRRRVPVVVRCHTPSFVLHRYYRPEEVPWARAGIEAREKACIARADGLTAPSADMADTIARECGLPAGRVEVIPNAVEVEPFVAAGGRRVGSDDCVILHVGRLDRGKGVEVLGQAIPEVLGRVPAARFVYVGADRPDGRGSTWRARLGDHFRARGVDGRVLFTGGVGPNELLDWYSRVDLAVVPSMIYESFSYTCAQAAAAGLPVVASRIGGIPDTIPDGVAGVLTEPGDAAGLAAALAGLAADPARRRALGAAGRRKAEAEFSSPAVAARVAAHYAAVR